MHIYKLVIIHQSGYEVPLVAHEAETESAAKRMCLDDMDVIIQSGGIIPGCELKVIKHAPE